MQIFVFADSEAINNVMKHNEYVILECPPKVEGQDKLNDVVIFCSHRLY